jgi:hypothetical protein
MVHSPRDADYSDHKCRLCRAHLSHGCWRIMLCGDLTCMCVVAGLRGCYAGQSVSLDVVLVPRCCTVSCPQSHRGPLQHMAAGAVLFV